MRVAALAVLLLATSCKKQPPPPTGIIDSLYTLRSFLNEAEVIAEGRVESVDVKERSLVIRLGTVRKGSPAAASFRLTVGKAGFFAGESDAVLRHAVPGAPVMIFSASQVMELYYHRYFINAYGDWAAEKGAAWGMAHIDMGGNRTWNGSVDALAALVPDALAGRAPSPPADPGRPPVDVAALNALPLPLQPVDEEYLPPAFRPSRPPPRKLREPDGPAEAVAGLREECFDVLWHQSLDQQAPLAADAQRPARVVVRRRGYLEVSRDGDYFLILESAGKAKLELGEDLLVGSEGGAPPPERGSDVALKAGRHAVTLVFEARAGDPPLRWLWSGPGLEREPVPADRLFRRP